jgi:V-type H+-transporting ATPase subunit E
MSEDKQIQSMIDFIEREAKEKAEELDQSAQEEYDVEKMRLVEAEKNKIRAATENKKKQVEVERRVNRANHTKEQRVRMMEERAGVLAALRDQTQQKIKALVNDQNKYRQLLTDLLRQALMAIQADTVVQCRKKDESLVQKAIKDVEAHYQKTTGKSASVTISKDSLVDEESWGGIILSSTDGRIVCNNTLSYRCDHAFKEQLPTIRFMLFNEKAGI